MERHTLLASACAVALTASAFALAPAAGADTVTGNLCDPVDVRAQVGTTVSFALTGACDLSSYEIYDGDPAVSVAPKGGGQLVWHQAVEKPGSACESGWGESWQQWARGGKGGPVCARDVVWGVGPTVAGNVSVTIASINDAVRLYSAGSADSAASPDVIGCNMIPGRPGYGLTDYCSPA